MSLSIGMSNSSFNHNDAIEHLLAVRQVLRMHFPFCKSMISLDIVLVILNANLKSEDIIVKALFASMGFSRTGIRYHFDALVNDGWVDIHQSTSDRRLKYCKPSKQLEDMFELAVMNLDKMNKTIIYN